MVLIQRVADEDLDYRLAAHVQFSCGPIQFLQHVRRHIQVNPLDGLHHFALIGEVARNVLSPLRLCGDGFR